MADAVEHHCAPRVHVQHGLPVVTVLASGSRERSVTYPHSPHQTSAHAALRSDRGRPQPWILPPLSCACPWARPPVPGEGRPRQQRQLAQVPVVAQSMQRPWALQGASTKRMACGARAPPMGGNPSFLVGDARVYRCWPWRCPLSPLRVAPDDLASQRPSSKSPAAPSIRERMHSSLFSRDAQGALVSDFLSRC